MGKSNADLHVGTRPEVKKILEMSGHGQFPILAIDVLNFFQSLHVPKIE